MACVCTSIHTYNLITRCVRWRYKTHVHFILLHYHNAKKFLLNPMTTTWTWSKRHADGWTRKGKKSGETQQSRVWESLVLDGRAGDEMETSYEAMPCHAMQCHNCSSHYFPGRKPKRRRGIPGSPLSGPNLLTLYTLLSKSLGRTRGQVEEASRLNLCPWK